LELESSLVASQNAVVVNPSVREPHKEADLRQQQQQRQVTEFPKTQVVTRQGGAEAFDQAEKFRQKQDFQEQPGAKGRQAIDAYQSLLREDKRAEISQLMGVDTYV